MSDTDGLVCKVKGEYVCTVIRANGEVERYPGIDNLLTNAFFTTEKMSTMGSGTYCSVGTGTTPASVTDTATENKVAGKYGLWTVSSHGAGPGGVGTEIIEEMNCTFDIGAVVGDITEISQAGDSSSTIFSRALIKDASGTPISIPVTSEDQLKITYYMRAYMAPSDTTYNAVDIKGVPTTIRVRTVNHNSGAMLKRIGYTYLWQIAFTYYGAAGWITQPASQQDPLSVESGDRLGGATGNTIVTQDIDNDSYKVVYQYDWGTSSHIGTDIAEIVFFNGSNNSNSAVAYMTFDPAFTKTSDDTFSYSLSCIMARG